MTDVDDAGALCLQFFDLLEQQVDLRVRQRCRWFVEDQNPAGVNEYTCNFDQLTLADAE